MTVLRSLLFVPADSERKLARAASSGADALILDLEDSVLPARKARAREMAADYLRAAPRGAGHPVLIVRINALETGLADDDLAAVVPARPDLVLLPKAEGGASIQHLDAKLAAQEAVAGLSDGAIGVLALITETARSMFVTGSYGGASARLAGVSWGIEDLSTELGIAPRDDDGTVREPLRLARSLCLFAAAATGVPALDTVSTALKEPERFRRECAEAARDGFSGKLAIHPDQVGPINAAFSPSAAAIAEARQIVAAFAARPGEGALALDGRMVDIPHLRRAERILAQAAALGLL